MRPFEGLNALDVEHLKTQLRVVDKIDLVNIHADRLRAVGREVVEADPADGEDGRRVPDRVLREQVRRLRGNVLRLHDALLREFVTAECRHSDGHFLQALRSLLRRDDDFFNQLGLRGGKCWSRKYENAEDQSVQLPHFHPLAAC